MTKEDNLQILKIPEDIEKDLIKKQYGIYNHSGVQICSWTKKSLTGKGVCYKENFYGVDCHSCMEMAPTVMWCQQNCTFCWRPTEYMKNINIKEEEVDEPKEIIDNLIQKRFKLISGFKGNDKIDMEKFENSRIPSHYAISLSGEPTLYPKLPEMVKYLKTLPKTKTIFVVSNGQIPEYYEKLQKDEDTQPTQLYISLDAPNPELFKKINISLYKDGWERLNKSLELFSTLKCRKVLRMTQIKGMNDLKEHMQGYKKLIDKSKADIIEVKGYMYLGLSRKRHEKEQMPEFEDVEKFTHDLCNTLGNYEIAAEMKNSLIIILKRKDSNYELKIEKYENDR